MHGRQMEDTPLRVVKCANHADQAIRKGNTDGFGLGETPLRIIKCADERQGKVGQDRFGGTDETPLRVVRCAHHTKANSAKY